MRDSTIVCCSHCGKDHSVFETQFEGCCSAECLSLLCKKEERKRIIALARERERERALVYDFAEANALSDFAAELEEEKE